MFKRDQVANRDLHDQVFQEFKQNDKKGEFDWRDGVGLVRNVELPKLGKVNLAVASGRVWLDPAQNHGLGIPQAGWYDAENIQDGPKDDAIVKGGIQMARDANGRPTMWRPHDGAWWRSKGVTGEEGEFGFFAGDKKVGLINPGVISQNLNRNIVAGKALAAATARVGKKAAAEVGGFLANTVKGVTTREGIEATSLAASDIVRSRVNRPLAEDYIWFANGVFGDVDSDKSANGKRFSLAAIEQAESQMEDSVDLAQNLRYTDGYYAGLEPSKKPAQPGPISQAVRSLFGDNATLDANDARLVRQAFIDAKQRVAAGHKVDVAREIRRAVGSTVVNQTLEQLDASLASIARTELGDDSMELSKLWNDDGSLNKQFVFETVAEKKLGIPRAEFYKLGQEEREGVVRRVSEIMGQNEMVKAALDRITTMSKVVAASDQTAKEKREGEVRAGKLYETATSNINLAEFVLASRLMGVGIRGALSPETLKKIGTKGLQHFGTKFAFEYGQNAAASLLLNTAENARNSGSFGEFLGNTARQGVTDVAMSVPGLQFAGPKKMGAVGARLVGDAASAATRGVAFGTADAAAGNLVNKALGRESSFEDELGKSIGHMLALEVGFKSFGLAKDLAPKRGTLDSQSHGLSSNLALESQVTKWFRNMKNPPTKEEFLALVEAKASAAVNEMSAKAVESGADLDVSKAQAIAQNMVNRYASAVETMDRRGLFDAKKPAKPAAVAPVAKPAAEPAKPVATEAKLVVATAEAKAPGIVEAATRIQPPDAAPRRFAPEGAERPAVPDVDAAADRAAAEVKQEGVNEILAAIGEGTDAGLRKAEMKIRGRIQKGDPELAASLMDQVKEARAALAPAPAKPAPAAAKPAPTVAAMPKKPSALEAIKAEATRASENQAKPEEVKLNPVLEGERPQDRVPDEPLDINEDFFRSEDDALGQEVDGVGLVTEAGRKKVADKLMESVRDLSGKSQDSHSVRTKIEGLRRWAAEVRDRIPDFDDPGMMSALDAVDRAFGKSEFLEKKAAEEAKKPLSKGMQRPDGDPFDNLPRVRADRVGPESKTTLKKGALESFVANMVGLAKGITHPATRTGKAQPGVIARKAVARDIERLAQALSAEKDEYNRPYVTDDGAVEVGRLGLSSKNAYDEANILEYLHELKSRWDNAADPEVPIYKAKIADRARFMADLESGWSRANEGRLTGNEKVEVEAEEGDSEHPLQDRHMLAKIVKMAPDVVNAAAGREVALLKQRSVLRNTGVAAILDVLAQRNAADPKEAKRIQSDKALNDRIEADVAELAQRHSIPPEMVDKLRALSSQEGTSDLRTFWGKNGDGVFELRKEGDTPEGLMFNLRYSKPGSPFAHRAESAKRAMAESRRVEKSVMKPAQELLAKFGEDPTGGFLGYLRSGGKLPMRLNYDWAPGMDPVSRVRTEYDGGTGTWRSRLDQGFVPIPREGQFTQSPMTRKLSHTGGAEESVATTQRYNTDAWVQHLESLVPSRPNVVETIGFREATDIEDRINQRFSVMENKHVKAEIDAFNLAQLAHRQAVASGNEVAIESTKRALAAARSAVESKTYDLGPTFTNWVFGGPKRTPKLKSGNKPTDNVVLRDKPEPGNPSKSEVAKATWSRIAKQIELAESLGNRDDMDVQADMESMKNLRPDEVFDVNEDGSLSPDRMLDALADAGLLPLEIDLDRAVFEGDERPHGNQQIADIVKALSEGGEIPKSSLGRALVESGIDTTSPHLLAVLKNMQESNALGRKDGVPKKRMNPGLSVAEVEALLGPITVETATNHKVVGQRTSRRPSDAELAQNPHLANDGGFGGTVDRPGTLEELNAAAAGDMAFSGSLAAKNRKMAQARAEFSRALQNPFVAKALYDTGLVRLRGGGELARVKNGSKALEYVTSSLLRDKRVTEGTIANFRAHLRGIAEKFRIAHVDDRAANPFTEGQRPAFIERAEGGSVRTPADRVPGLDRNNTRYGILRRVSEAKGVIDSKNQRLVRPEAAIPLLEHAAKRWMKGGRGDDFGHPVGEGDGRTFEPGSTDKLKTTTKTFDAEGEIDTTETRTIDPMPAGRGIGTLGRKLELKHHVAATQKLLDALRLSPREEKRHMLSVNKAMLASGLTPSESMVLDLYQQAQGDGWKLGSDVVMGGYRFSNRDLNAFLEGTNTELTSEIRAQMKEALHSAAGGRGANMKEVSADRGDYLQDEGAISSGQITPGGKQTMSALEQDRQNAVMRDAGVHQAEEGLPGKQAMNVDKGLMSMVAAGDAAGDNPGRSVRLQDAERQAQRDPVPTGKSKLRDTPGVEIEPETWDAYQQSKQPKPVQPGESPVPTMIRMAREAEVSAVATERWNAIRKSVLETARSENPDFDSLPEADRDAALERAYNSKDHTPSSDAVVDAAIERLRNESMEIGKGLGFERDPNTPMHVQGLKKRMRLEQWASDDATRHLVDQYQERMKILEEIGESFIGGKVKNEAIAAMPGMKRADQDLRTWVEFVRNLDPVLSNKLVLEVGKSDDRRAGEMDLVTGAIRLFNDFKDQYVRLARGTEAAKTLDGETLGRARRLAARTLMHETFHFLDAYANPGILDRVHASFLAMREARFKDDPAGDLYAAFGDDLAASGRPIVRNEAQMSALEGLVENGHASWKNLDGGKALLVMDSGELAGKQIALQREDGAIMVHIPGQVWHNSSEFAAEMFSDIMGLSSDFDQARRAIKGLPNADSLMENLIDLFDGSTSLIESLNAVLPPMEKLSRSEREARGANQAEIAGKSNASRILKLRQREGLAKGSVEDKADIRRQLEEAGGEISAREAEIRKGMRDFMIDAIGEGRGLGTEAKLHNNRLTSLAQRHAPPDDKEAYNKSIRSFMKKRAEDAKRKAYESEVKPDDSMHQDMDDEQGFLPASDAAIRAQEREHTKGLVDRVMQAMAPVGDALSSFGREATDTFRHEMARVERDKNGQAVRRAAVTKVVKALGKHLIAKTNAKVGSAAAKNVNPILLDASERASNVVNSFDRAISGEASTFALDQMFRNSHKVHNPHEGGRDLLGIFQAVGQRTHGSDLIRILNSKVKPDVVINPEDGKPMANPKGRIVSIKWGGEDVEYAVRTVETSPGKYENIYRSMELMQSLRYLQSGGTNEDAAKALPKNVKSDLDALIPIIRTHNVEFLENLLHEGFGDPERIQALLDKTTSGNFLYLGQMYANTQRSGELSLYVQDQAMDLTAEKGSTGTKGAFEAKVHDSYWAAFMDGGLLPEHTDVANLAKNSLRRQAVSVYHASAFRHMEGQGLAFFGTKEALGEHASEFVEIPMAWGGDFGETFGFRLKDAYFAKGQWQFLTGNKKKGGYSEAAKLVRAFVHKDVYPVWKSHFGRGFERNQVYSAFQMGNGFLKATTLTGPDQAATVGMFHAMLGMSGGAFTAGLDAARFASIAIKQGITNTMDRTFRDSYRNGRARGLSKEEALAEATEAATYGGSFLALSARGQQLQELLLQNNKHHHSHIMSGAFEASPMEKFFIVASQKSGLESGRQIALERAPSIELTKAITELMEVPKIMEHSVGLAVRRALGSSATAVARGAETMANSFNNNTQGGMIARWKLMAAYRQMREAVNRIYRPDQNPEWLRQAYADMADPNSQVMGELQRIRARVDNIYGMANLKTWTMSPGVRAFLSAWKNAFGWTMGKGRLAVDIMDENLSLPGVRKVYGPVKQKLGGSLRSADAPNYSTRFMATHYMVTSALHTILAAIGFAAMPLGKDDDNVLKKLERTLYLVFGSRRGTRDQHGNTRRYHWGYTDEIASFFRTFALDPSWLEKQAVGGLSPGVKLLSQAFSEMTHIGMDEFTSEGSRLRANLGLMPTSRETDTRIHRALDPRYQKSPWEKFSAGLGRTAIGIIPGAAPYGLSNWQSMDKRNASFGQKVAGQLGYRGAGADDRARLDGKEPPKKK